MKITQQQLEAHLWGAANILRGKTAGQDYKNYILSLMFYKRLCDQWECEADDAIAELERQQGKPFTEKQKAIFRARGEHRFNIPDGSRWGDVKAASTNLGEVLTKAMRAVAAANDELRGVFTVDWNQPAPDGSGNPLIPNEVVHALIQHFDEHDLSNKSVPSDVLGRAYEYLIKQFADDAGAKAGEFFTPPEVVDTLVRILKPHPGDTVYDPTSGSGGMLVHTADYLREHAHHPTSASYFAQEMNWGNAAIGKINSVLHGLEADIKAGASTITDPQFLEDGHVKKFSLVLANFPFSDEFWWLKPEQQTDDKKKKDKLKKEIFGKEGFKDPFGRFGRGTGFKAPPPSYGDYAFILHIVASLAEDGRAGIVCPQGVLFRGQAEVEEETGEVDDVLMTEGGDIDKLGRGTIWEGQIKDCLHQNHIFRIRAHRDLLEPEFFSLVVESDIAKRYFNRVAKRTTNLASINKTQVRAFRFPVPATTDEQCQIIKIMKTCKRTVAGLLSKQVALVELKRSLLHDLLTGTVRVRSETEATAS